LRCLCWSLLLLGVTFPAAASGGPPPRSSLKTVEGVVLETDITAGEGGIDVVRVSLAPDGDREHPLEILLAPQEIMNSIGFAIEPGDRLKVNYFVSEEGSCKAHKVLNTTRSLMVRLRTLRQIPLWNNQGHWQGGQGRMCHGQGPGRGGPQ
jgi:hypothetical protein